MVNPNVTPSQAHMDQSSCSLFAKQSVSADMQMGTLGPISGQIELDKLTKDYLVTKGYHQVVDG